MAKKKKAVQVSVKFNVGIPCKRCGQRFINPLTRLTHVCVVRMTTRRMKRDSGKGGFGW